MAEVRFYHLTTLSLDQALPPMLERCLARGWRVVVRGGDPGRLAALDARLWTYSDTGFLPHGTAADGPGADQPIWLTPGPDLPNAPNTLFLIDRAPADLAELAGFETTALLFDDTDPAAVEAARAQWRAVTARGLAAVYWAQDAAGAWVKKAEAKAAAPA